MGLIRDFYYVNNPIYYKWTGMEPAEKVSLGVKRSGVIEPTRSFILYANPDGEIEIDISKIARSYIRSDGIDSIATGTEVESGKEILQFGMSKFNQDGSLHQPFDSFARWFILGGKFSQEDNVGFYAPRTISLTDTIPFWNGFPPLETNIDANGKMTINRLLDSEKTEKLFDFNCNGAKVVFRNHLGGYSSWQFENYSISNKVKQSKEYYNRDRFLTKQPEITKTIKLNSRVNSKWFKILRSLGKADEVYLVDFKQDDNGMDRVVPLERLTRVRNVGQTFEININDSVSDFGFEFELLTTWN